MANKLFAKNKMMKKLQKSLAPGKKLNDHDDLCYDNSTSLPEDVKEGHFAVVAVDDEEGLAQRFVVPLRFLRHPMFLGLLEKAAEEYGFDHGGALTIPCRLSEMERILSKERCEVERGARVRHGCRLNSNNLCSRIVSMKYIV